MNVLATVKEHPVYVVGALGVVFVAYIYLTSGGGGDTGGAGSGDIYAAQNAAGDQLQLASIAANVNAAAIGADLEKTKIGSQTAISVAQLSKDLAITKINADRDTMDLANTLTAGVAMKQIQGTVDMKSLETNASVTNTSTLASALITQAGYTRDVSIANTNAMSATNQAYIKAQSDARSQDVALQTYQIEHQDNSVWWNPLSWF